ncbi:hypothetical protein HI914_07272 [Erysiphe necator]|nr:hypothetical protein HI914_07272 [Erysiphe necator]
MPIDGRWACGLQYPPDLLRTVSLGALSLQMSIEPRPFHSRCNAIHHFTIRHQGSDFGDT